MAFGENRMVPEYSGNTIRLRRLSDNAEANFGFDSLGIVNRSAIDAWRAGADVLFIRAYCQMGSGKTLEADGNVHYVRSGAYARFGTVFNETTAQLTRSASDGSSGFDTGDDVGCVKILASGLSQTTGFEVHLLCSFNERKFAGTTGASDALGGNTVRENLFAFGSRSNVLVSHFISGGSNWQSGLTYATTAGSSVSVTSQPNAGATAVKQFSQHIYSYRVNGSRFDVIENGRVYQTASYNATHSANMAAGVLNNGDLVFANSFNSTSTNALRTSLRANVLIGGIIITAELTDAERFALRARLNQVAQMHRRKTRAEVAGYWDEIIDFRNVNPTTGLVTGEKGKLTLAVNVATVPAGTPAWQFNQTVPNLGVAGLYCPSDTNLSHGFKATSTYGAGWINGTAAMFAAMDATGFSGGFSNNVSATMIQGTGDQFGGQNANWSWGLGYDHNCVTFTGMMANAREAVNLMGDRKRADETDWVYDLFNQANIKYNRNTPNTSMVYGEAHPDGTLTQAWYEGTVGVGTPPYLLDAPVRPSVPENLPNVWKRDCAILQIATWKAPAGYNRADDYATRKPLRLQGENRSYVTVGGVDMPVGHHDGSVAINRNAGVVDSTDDATIMSHQFQHAFKGHRIMALFAPTVLTPEQIEETQVNFYKLLEAA